MERRLDEGEIVLMHLSQLRYTVLVAALALPFSSSAHHAFTGVFDMDNVSEMTGELTEMSWRNPHVRFSIRTMEGETWEVETNSVSIIGRMGISSDLMQLGDEVTVAGFKALSGSQDMWTNNVQLADGREIVTRPGVDPYWSNSTLGTSADWLAEGTEATDSDARGQGIFRVWSTHFTGASRRLFGDELPLTAAAAAVRASFDPVSEELISDCTPKGVPWIMAQPYPVAFVDQGDTILFQIEEYDSVRTIYMDPDAVLDNTPTKLGQSRGRWVGEALHVTTRRIDWPFFDASGTPQSDAVELFERFSLSEDGSQLIYRLTATDPATFTRPVELNKAWMWRPGEVVKPYECTPSD
jgi:hypothetical protein